MEPKLRKCIFALEELSSELDKCRSFSLFQEEYELLDEKVRLLRLSLMDYVYQGSFSSNVRRHKASKVLLGK